MYKRQTDTIGYEEAHAINPNVTNSLVDNMVLLFTAPVSVWKIVCGKYLGMVTILFIPMAIICTYPLIMGKYGTISYPMAYTAIFGFFLMGCGNIAVGLFLSSITESQIIAAVLTFAVSVSYTHLLCWRYT